MRRISSNLNILLAGPKAIGKSSFLDTLISKKIAIQSGEINVYQINLKCEGVNRQLTFVEFPGLNASINDEESIIVLENYLKLQLDLYLQEESKVHRDPYYVDTRVHCMIYFVRPNFLRQRDIEILKRVSPYANILLAVGKSDMMSEEEICECRTKINNQIDEHGLSVFNLVECESGLINSNKGLVDFHPFMLGKGGDFDVLKEVLLGSHMEYLKDYTSSEIYEKHRESVLHSMFERKENSE